MIDASGCAGRCAASLAKKQRQGERASAAINLNGRAGRNPSAGSPVKLLVLHVGLTVASCEVDMGLILVKSVSIFMNPYSIDIDLSIEY